MLQSCTQMLPVNDNVMYAARRRERRRWRLAGSRPRGSRSIPARFRAIGVHAASSTERGNRRRIACIVFAYNKIHYNTMN